MIILDNVSKSYKIKGKNFRILKDLNLTIHDGESIALLGRNGAGKSTLLRIIGGIETPDYGRIIKKDNQLFKKVICSEKLCRLRRFDFQKECFL